MGKKLTKINLNFYLVIVVFITAVLVTGALILILPSVSAAPKSLSDQQGGTEVPDSEKVLIKVGGYYGAGGLTTYDPFTVAQNLGYFKHIKIEAVDIQPGPTALAALATGRIQASHLQYSISINAIAKGAKLKVVAAAHGGQNTSNLHFYVPKESPIKAIKDLKGKKIGGIQIGDTTYYALSDKLKEVGLSIKDVQLVSIPPGQALQVLNNGQVDGAGAWSDYEQKPIEETGKYRLLFTVYDILPKGLIHCGLTVQEKLIRENPEIVKELVEGFEKVNTWLQKNPQKGKEAHLRIAKERGVDPALIQKYYSPVDIRQHSLAYSSDVNYFIVRLEESNLIPSGKIKPEDIITNEFNLFASQAK
jgi:ABC-type nitrate/sulfonate/bicarbonate transport system substrate-binding protein